MSRREIRKDKQSGKVYTPREWADWAVNRFDIHLRWLDGATLLDPTAGEGSLLESVIAAAIRTGRPIDEADLLRLQGIERDAGALAMCRHRIATRFGLTLPPDSLVAGNYFTTPPIRRPDVVIGNPPWITFADLPSSEKESLKSLFRRSGLVENPRALLLGGSRIDLAALVVITALDRDLLAGGEAFFFLPISLFTGDAAHSGFRRGNLPGGRPFSLEEIYDITGGAAFPGAGTRYCFARVGEGKISRWPVPWYRAGADGSWIRREARPLCGEGSSLLPLDTGENPPPLPRVPRPRGTKPRQGVNSGGAADVFILEEVVPIDEKRVIARSHGGFEGGLPSRLVYPLMTPANFEGSEEPKRYLFLPYRRDGRPLEPKRVAEDPDTRDWLRAHREILRARKGVFLGRSLSQGYWWALLGVGPYAFAPYKVAWEAYGRREFRPRLFGPGRYGVWQGNQALHAYLPFDNAESAQNALDALKNPAVSWYLRRLGGAGTKSWAQPGRMNRLLEMGDTETGTAGSVLEMHPSKETQGPHRTPDIASDEIVQIKP